MSDKLTQRNGGGKIIVPASAKEEISGPRVCRVTIGGLPLEFYEDPEFFQQVKPGAPPAFVAEILTGLLRIKDAYARQLVTVYGQVKALQDAMRDAQEKIQWLEAKLGAEASEASDNG